MARPLSFYESGDWGDDWEAPWEGGGVISPAKQHAIIKEFLQPASTLTEDETIEALLDHLPPHPIMRTPYDMGYKAHHKMWLLCVDMARDIPYTHPSQLKFARLLSRICTKSRATVVHDSPENPNHEIQRPIGFNGMIGEMGTNWVAGVVSGYAIEAEDKEDETRRIMNEHAFMALLSAHQLDVDDRVPMWRLGDTLEHEKLEIAPYSEDPLESSAAIGCAALWILNDGVNVFQKCQSPPTTYVVKDKEMWFRYSKPGDLWISRAGSEAKPDFSVARWDFWRTRFQELAEDKQNKLMDEVRVLARKAADYMGALKAASLFELDY